MSIFGLIIFILVCGFACYCVFKYATDIPAGFKNLIYIVLMGACILYVLYAFGILGNLNTPVPQIGGHR